MSIKRHYKTGDKYYSLTLKSSYDGTDNYFSTKPTIFTCECGNEHTATLNNVTRGVVKHCTECSKKLKSKNKKTHGHSECRKNEDPLGYKCYYTWQAMKSRCYYEKDKRFKEYGGRGIEVCDRWKNSYENFLNDMGLPRENDSIERIDVNGNYNAENCIWIPVDKQASNKRDNRKITAFGKTMNLNQWAKETGIKRETIAKRLNSGYSPENALKNEKASKAIYKNPKGEFKSLEEAGEAYGLKTSATHNRFKSNSYPDWIKTMI